jgi:hypothetical protein
MVHLRRVANPVYIIQYTVIHRGDPGVDGRIILRMICRKWGVGV